MWTSKLRYGLQLCLKVRLQETEETSYNMKMTQQSQNKILRVMDGSRIADKRSVKKMLDKFNMLSVNQIAAQIKLTEMWKFNTNEKEYPITIKRAPGGAKENRMGTRPGTRRDMMEGGKMQVMSQSFTRDAGRIWNRAPDNVKKAKTLIDAKRQIRAFCKTLPI